MAQQNIEQNGKLSEHPLVELIWETCAAGLSGAFRLGHESVKTVIYLAEGEIIFAVSNLRPHRLAEVARRQNLVTEKQLATVGQKASDADVGAELVAAGVLTPEALTQLQTFQVADVLRPALLWIDGTWSFDPRVRLAQDVRVRLNVPALLMESARRLPVEFVARRFANTNEELTIEAELATDAELQPMEAFVLSRMDMTGMRVHELTSISGLPEPEALRVIYALSLGGLLRRDKWMRAFSEELVVRLQKITAASKKAEQEGKTSAATVVREAPAPVETSEVKEVLPELDEQEELERFFSRLDAAEDHYQVLGVGHQAAAADIKKVYHALARRFHPDRFHQDAGTQLHTRLQATFARVAQAYDTLRHAQARSAYDLKLQTQKKMRSTATSSAARPGNNLGGAQTSDGRPGKTTANQPPATRVEQEAEESFQRGLAALKMGNHTVAIAMLGEAARRVPGQPRYRAYHARALAGNRQMRHKAEAEFQAAISLDAKNASYRVMLAELYRDLGMKRRAQGELKRALSIDPEHVDARRQLDELG